MTNAEDIRHMTLRDLMALGVADLAYVRPVEIEGQNLFAVFTADGTQVAVLPSREAAIATILGNDLDVVSVH